MVPALVAEIGEEASTPFARARRNEANLASKR